MAEVTNDRILEVLREEIKESGSSIDFGMAQEIFELEARAQFATDRNEVNRRMAALVQIEIERRLD